MENYAINVEHLSKHYGDFLAVDDVSFSVSRGKCTAFLGPNGAGKTTTIKTLYGKALADNLPQTAIQVMGFTLPKQELEAKSLIGLVPQDNCLDEELNVEQNLLIYSRFYGLRGDKAKKRIAELLDFLDLGEKRKSRVRELSGGMQRRLVIARALLNSPSLLILDEPTTGLDPQVRLHIWDRLRELMKQGVTVLLTTHYMDEAWQIADEIILMDKGKKVLQGPPRELMTRHIERFVLEIPDPARETGLASLLATNEATKALRAEISDVRAYVFGNDKAVLEKVALELTVTGYLLRETNLEDLFIAFTGRALNE